MAERELELEQEREREQEQERELEQEREQEQEQEQEREQEQKPMMTDNEYRGYRNVQRMWAVVRHIQAFCGTLVLLAVLVLAWSVAG